MEFRTVIEPVRSKIALSHDVPLLMLGSCFTDEVGQRLQIDGFDVCRNPLGPLYNPLSLANFINRTTKLKLYTLDDLTEGPRGWHCLDYASHFSGLDAISLISNINLEQAKVRRFIGKRPIVILTLGSSFVYRRADNGKPVGNCHKFPASFFNNERLSVEETIEALKKCVTNLATAGVRKVILTVSPIRHLAYGLHGNTLSKATLQLAADTICSQGRAEYFPAYEMLIDDLRDYRFYDSDMKHPSEVAVDYIYEIFCQSHMDKATIARALECRKAYKASQHRNILT